MNTDCVHIDPCSKIVSKGSNLKPKCFHLLYIPGTTATKCWVEISTDSVHYDGIAINIHDCLNSQYLHGDNKLQWDIFSASAPANN